MRNPTRTLGEGAIAKASIFQIEAAGEFLKRRLMIDMDFVRARQPCPGYRGTICYWAEGIGTERIAELEYAGRDQIGEAWVDMWFVINCNPLFRRALQASYVEFRKDVTR